MKYPSILILLFLLLLVVPALAENNTTVNQSVATVTVVPTPAYNNSRISQGQCVEIGGTYDVSGVIGFSFTTDANTFAYYGKYESSYDPSFDNTSVLYKYEMPNGRSAYYSFFINPDTFWNRTGYWYQYTGTYERAANKRAFYVSQKCVIQTISKQTNVSNESVVVIDNNVEKILTSQGIKPVALSQLHVADVLIARDDPLAMSGLNGTYRVWLFGRVTGIYGMDVNLSESKIVIPTDQIEHMEPGSYNLILQEKGANGLYELDYVKADNTEKLIPALRSVDVVEITGYQPRLVQPKVEDILSKYTDDKYKIYKIEIQEPSIEINGYQELIINNDKSILEVAGYTNKQPDTKILLTIDHNVRINKSDKFKPVDVLVEKGDTGSMRTFHGYIEIDKTNIAPGYHDVTATTSSGKFQTVAFYIMESLKPIDTPTTYYSYIDGHPFIPTPTPITIIERPTPIVVRETVTIFVPVTPSQESVDEATWKSISFIAEMIALGLVGCVVIGYLIAAFIRSRKPPQDDFE